MKTIPCEQGLAAAMLWLASRLTVWGTRLECVAQQRAAARAEQQAQRRAAAWMIIRPGGRNGRRANPCADGKGAGESTPALRAIIYE